MSTSSKPQTTTTTQEPPRYLQPFLQEGMQGAQSQYLGGGTQVTPFAPQTQQALDMAQQRALAGSPVGNAAQNYAQQTLSGGFMGKNPWLDQTFNRAAGAVTNQVQSNFGTAGRNPRGADAAGFAGEGYNDLAAQIYGGDYQAERTRQQQLVPYAGQLAAQDYANIDRLGQVGGAYEALSREYAAQPSTSLDQYLARLQGYPGQTSTSIIPTQSNPWAGAAGGAMTGAMMGTTVFPGIGTGMGAAIGGIMGGLGSYYG
jgi:hypothetical protein